MHCFPCAKYYTLFALDKTDIHWLKERQKFSSALPPWFPSYLSEIWKIKCSASTTNAVSFEASASAKKSKVVMRGCHCKRWTRRRILFYLLGFAAQRLLDFVWRNRARTCGRIRASCVCVWPKVTEWVSAFVSLLINIYILNRELKPRALELRLAIRFSASLAWCLRAIAFILCHQTRTHFNLYHPLSD